jgi:hypothetical protein
MSTQIEPFPPLLHQLNRFLSNQATSSTKASPSAPQIGRSIGSPHRFATSVAQRACLTWAEVGLPPPS